MLLRVGLAAGGLAFTAGIAAGFTLGVAAVGAACLARRAMKDRTAWKDSPDTLSSAAGDDALVGGEAS